MGRLESLQYCEIQGLWMCQLGEPATALERIRRKVERRERFYRLDCRYQTESKPEPSPSVEPPDLLDVIFDLESKVKALTIESRSENVRLRNLLKKDVNMTKGFTP